MIVQQVVYMLVVFANNDFKINAKTWSSANCSFRRWNNFNWRPIWKRRTRKILNQKEINKNIKSIKKVFNKILNTSNKKTKPIFVNNAEWLTKLNYIEFLRDIGSHFTINKMLTFDSVKLRLEREQSLSYMEFNYMILQAYDFYQLFKKKNCILQIGGSDQWGNIVNGVELIRRLIKKRVFWFNISFNNFSIWEQKWEKQKKVLFG